jgi:hypothetical protein
VWTANEPLNNCAARARFWRMWQSMHIWGGDWARHRAEQRSRLRSCPGWSSAELPTPDRNHHRNGLLDRVLENAARLWQPLRSHGLRIIFAHTSSIEAQVTHACSPTWQYPRAPTQKRSSGMEEIKWRRRIGDPTEVCGLPFGSCSWHARKLRTTRRRGFDGRSLKNSSLDIKCPYFKINNYSIVLGSKSGNPVPAERAVEGLGLDPSRKGPNSRACLAWHR